MTWNETHQQRFDEQRRLVLQDRYIRLTGTILPSASRA
jgi:hypothetical protein